MNISILRRIEAAEQRVKRVAEPPTLIMIHYELSRGDVDDRFAETGSRQRELC